MGKAGALIGLIAGAVMLALGLLFLLWQWLRPAEPPEPSDIPPADQVRE